MRVSNRTAVLAIVASAPGSVPDSSTASVIEAMVRTMARRKAWRFPGLLCLNCRTWSGPTISKTSSTDMGALKSAFQNCWSSSRTSSVSNRLIPSPKAAWLSELPMVAWSAEGCSWRRPPKRARVQSCPPACAPYVHDCGQQSPPLGVGMRRSGP